MRSSPLNEQGLTSAASLGDVAAGAFGHFQGGEDLRGEEPLTHRRFLPQVLSVTGTDASVLSPLSP